jgi:hypothetical protein
MKVTETWSYDAKSKNRKSDNKQQYTQVTYYTIQINELLEGE